MDTKKVLVPKKVTISGDFVDATLRKTTDVNHIPGCLKTEAKFFADGWTCVKVYNLDELICSFKDMVNDVDNIIEEANQLFELSKSGVYFHESKQTRVPVAIGIRPCGEICAIFENNGLTSWYDIEILDGRLVYSGANNNTATRETLIETLKFLNSDRACGWSFQVAMIRYL